MKQFFMNMGKAEFRNILALMCITGVFYLVSLLIFKPIPDKNSEVIYLIVGQVLALGFGGVTSYYFGSSKGPQENKTDNQDHQ